MTRQLNITQSSFQRFFKRSLLIWQKYCYKSFHRPPNNSGIDSVKNFYKNLNIPTKFQLKPTTGGIVLKLLKTIDILIAVGFDNLPGRFLKVGTVTLAKSFLRDTVNCFHSYLTDQAFLVSIENKYRDISKISCGVLQGSILGPLPFLIYVNDMK